MAALEISPEQVSYVIAMAREIADALPSDDSIEDESHRGEAVNQELVAEHAYDTTYQELLSFVQTLSEDEQAALVAILWIGRGTFEPEELDSALSEAEAIGARRRPGYLLSQTLLAEHLEEGMIALGLSTEEF